MAFFKMFYLLVCTGIDTAVCAGATGD